MYGQSKEAYALAVSLDGNQLYVGGEFKECLNGAAASLSCKNLAMWDGTKWHNLAASDSPEDGVDNDVRALLTDSLSGMLYVGGKFLKAGGGATEYNRIVSWSPSAKSWGAFPFSTGNGFDSRVYAFMEDAANLYIGGDFSTSSDGAIKAGKLAIYDLEVKDFLAEPIQSDTSAQLDNFMAFAMGPALCNCMYVGGQFTGLTSEDGTKNVAQVALNGFEVTGLGAGGLVAEGGGAVRAMAFAENILYVGGDIAQTVDQSVKFGNIASYIPATSTWSALTGDTGEIGVMGGRIQAIAVVTSPILAVYVGGAFTSLMNGDGSAGAACTNLAIFALGKWMAPSDIKPLPPYPNIWVNSLLFWKDKMVVAGRFLVQAADGETASGIATLDPSTFQWGHM